MSSKVDVNYKSYSQLEPGTRIAGENLDPIAIGFKPLSWDDTCKIHQCQNVTFDGFYVVGGREDCVDGANRNRGNVLSNFTCVPRGKYVLTWKGDSDGNDFDDWFVVGSGKVCDIEIGNWSHVDQGNPRGNVFRRWSKVGGEPITYCYRFGCKPKFEGMNVRHLWWRSVGITLYFYAKLALFKISKGKIK